MERDGAACIGIISGDFSDAKPALQRRVETGQRARSQAFFRTAARLLCTHHELAGNLRLECVA